MTKPWMLILLGVLIGLFVTGGLLLIARPDLGTPIALHPAPSPTPTHPPLPTRTPEPILVQIAGAVQRPGVYALAEGSRLTDLITRAEGLAPDADLDRVNQVALLHDGTYFYIPAVGEAIPETAANAPGYSPAEAAEQYDYPLDLNQAGQEELESLPGIGPSKAADILNYREQSGPFASVDDLANVPGIGEATVESLREYLFVEGE